MDFSKLKNGDRLKVVTNYSGHGFEIGNVVYVVSISEDGKSVRCLDAYENHRNAISDIREVELYDGESLCTECDTGEMILQGHTSPNGTMRYTCTVCGYSEQFP